MKSGDFVILELAPFGTLALKLTGNPGYDSSMRMIYKCSHALKINVRPGQGKPSRQYLPYTEAFDIMDGSFVVAVPQSTPVISMTVRENSDMYKELIQETSKIEVTGSVIA